MSRRYCFTWNNPDQHSGDVLELFAHEYCPYLVYGREVGEGGTYHYQGFFTLKKTQRLAALKRLIAPSVHFEVAMGTSVQASDYCKKDGDFTEFGECPSQGSRTDLSTATTMIKKGASMQEVADECSEVFVKFGRGLRDLALTLAQPFDYTATRGMWIYGPPGTGKSHTARRLDPDAYLKAQSKWWDGYANQHTVILDDLDTNVLGHYLKIWADKYACTGETKGGTVNLQHRTFIVTSNYHPGDLWKESDDQQMLEAILRRFRVYHKANRNTILEHCVLNAENALETIN